MARKSFAAEAEWWLLQMVGSTVLLVPAILASTHEYCTTKSS